MVAVPLRTRDDPDPRRADQAVALTSQPTARSTCWRAGEQPDRVGGLPPRHEADGRVLGEAEQVLQPVAGGFLGHGRSR